MRPSTKKALFVAVGLAVAGAELGVPSRSEDGSDAAGAARRLASLWRAFTATPAETGPAAFLTLPTDGREVVLTSEIEDAAGLASPRIVTLRRERIVRRARRGLATASVDL